MNRGGIGEITGIALHPMRANRHYALVADAPGTLFRDARWNAKRGLLAGVGVASGAVVAFVLADSAISDRDPHRQLPTGLLLAILAIVVAAVAGTVALYLRSEVSIRGGEIVSRGPLRTRRLPCAEVTQLRPRQVYNGAYCTELRGASTRLRVAALPWANRDLLYPYLSEQAAAAGMDRVVRARGRRWTVSAVQIAPGEWATIAHRAHPLARPKFSHRGLSRADAVAMAETVAARIKSDGSPSA